MRTLALILCLILGAGGVSAQPAAVPPAGMTQQQFDALVEAISKSVADKLKAEGATPYPKAKSGKAAPAPQIVRTAPKQGPGEFAIFVQNFGKAVAAFP